MTLKQTFLRVFFAFEIIFFSFVYLFGAQGITALRQLQREDSNLNIVLKQLQTEVKNQEIEIATLQSDPYYLEKIAREHLHMARKNELIFIEKDNHV
jgi:cell division protein FtsB